MQLKILMASFIPTKDLGAPMSTQKPVLRPLLASFDNDVVPISVESTLAPCHRLLCLNLAFLCVGSICMGRVVLDMVIRRPL